MRKIHSDFVNQTQADPALAQDLLDATNWDMKAALQAFKGLSVTHTEQGIIQREMSTCTEGLATNWESVQDFQGFLWFLRE